MSVHGTSSGGVPEVWVDGDSAPREIRELLGRWGDRGRCRIRFFANRALPDVSDTEMTVVAGETTVDREILERLASTADERRRTTVIITRDIPLAERCLAYDCVVLNDRGTEFDGGTIAERRSIRDRNAEIRAMGLETIDRAHRFGKREVKLFADTLDRVLTRLKA
ncbi:MAG: DUF188 domain-containing protein [Alkalispirochaeta sp.]